MRKGTLALAFAALMLLAVPAIGSAAPDGKRKGKTKEIPLSVEVSNVNRSDVFCPSDSKTYTVRGHITGPRAAFRRGAKPESATLYSHGHSFAEFLWTFDKVPGYDTVGALARRGHISVTYDRLGYEKSDKPNGYSSCYGSEADVSNQIVESLKDGSYELGRKRNKRKPIRFERVAYAGHSQNAFGGEAVAYSFDSIDAYVHMSFADQNPTPALLVPFTKNEFACERNPLRANQDPRNPSGYQFRGKTDADFQKTNFVSAEPKVKRALTRMRNVDPCGYPRSAGTTLNTNLLLRGGISAPTLLLYGAEDPLFMMPQAAKGQAGGFSGVDDLTLEIFPNTGHALMFERSAPQFRRTLSRWLKERDFVFRPAQEGAGRGDRRERDGRGGGRDR